MMAPTLSVTRSPATSSSYRKISEIARFLDQFCGGVDRDVVPGLDIGQEIRNQVVPSTIVRVHRAETGDPTTDHRLLFGHVDGDAEVG